MTRLRHPLKATPAVSKARSARDLPATPASSSSQTLLARFDQPGRWLTALLVLALFLVALGFNVYQIGTPSIWFDEALSVTRARQSLPVLFQIVSVTQPNMALYYFLLHFWLSFMGLFGIHATELVVRLPSVFFSAIDTVILYFLARRFFGSLVAIFAALFYLLNTLQLTYAQETRSYTLQLLFLSLSWYALLVLFSSDLSRRRERNWWICFVLSSALAMYTQLFSELVLATQALVIVLWLFLPTAWRARARKRLRPLVISWVCFGLLSAPILYASRVGSKTGWLAIPTPGDVYRLFLTISAQSKILLGLFALAILLGLLVALLAALPSGQQPLKRLALLPKDEEEARRWRQRFLQLLPLAILLLCWMLCPVAISYIVSQKSTRLFSPRYLVVIVPALILLVALGLSVLRWRVARLVLGLCLLLLCLRYVPNYYHNAQVEDWRTGTQWLQQQYQPGDGLICYDNSQGCAVDIEYYLQAYPFGSAHFDADSPGYFPWVDYDTTNHLGAYQQALDTTAIQIYGEKHPRLFFGLGRASASNPQVQAALQWLNTHYRLITRESTSTLTFYLFDTTAYAPHLV
ncbi:MAG TPA: glycosyltransferase family 39 protein [Ktedonobacteraceae bacterium]|nr:glycosyltransferase family 39 protein [Ktedonobacteraceae bacterium]